MDQTAPPIYLTLQGAERDVFFSVCLLLSWCLHLHLSLVCSLSSALSWGWMKVSVQPGTHCIDHCCIGRTDRRAALWDDATRRHHSGFTQEGWSQTSQDETGSWPDFSESFCLSSSAKQPLDWLLLIAPSRTVQDMRFAYFEFCLFRTVAPLP